jgi:hypothetical protein
MRFKDVTIAAGGSSSLVAVVLVDRVTQASGATFSVQPSAGLRGVSFHGSERPGGPCGQGSDFPTLNCDLGDPTFGPGAQGNVFALAGGMSAGTAPVGTVGTLTATLSIPGRAPVVRTAKVRVVEGVDLTVEGQSLDVRPGVAFDLPLTVSNGSEIVGDGAAMVFETSRPYESTRQFRNCRYDRGRLRACSFAERLQPGRTYRAMMPSRLRADTFAPGEYEADADWMTRDEFADLDRFLTAGNYTGLGRPGSGGVLTLTPVATAAGQADPQSWGNRQRSILRATGSNDVDLVAVGAHASGDVGAVVDIRLGVRNEGPATLDTQSLLTALFYTVNVPAGSTAVTVPESCYPQESTDGTIHIGDDGGQPGRSTYWCHFRDTLLPGKTGYLALKLRITEKIPRATALVQVGRNAPGVPNTFKGDASKSNNVSAIVLNDPARPGETPGGGNPPGGGNGDGAGDDGAGDDGGEGGGGPLPITGPRAAQVGGAGILLLLAGAASIVLARRRRTHFRA